MGLDSVKKFLMKHPNKKFMAGEMIQPLNMSIEAVRCGLRKLTKQDVHYDTRFKKEKGHHYLTIDSDIKLKAYKSKYPVLYFWFEP